MPGTRALHAAAARRPRRSCRGGGSARLRCAADCLDLGGLTQSRGGTKGAKVYTSVADVPSDRTDLAIIWVRPRSAKHAVEIAHEAGARRVWFSFQTGHRDAVARARELGMEIVEIGRCPVHYMAEQVPACRAHTMLIKLSGTYRRPPQTDADAKRRELV